MSKRKDEWPKTLWILNEDNIQKGSYGRGDRRCLGGWCTNQFSGYQRARADFGEKLKENLVATGSNQPLSCLLPTHNDKGGLTARQLAEAWNMTLADFGYVEIDESEWGDYE